MTVSVPGVDLVGELGRGARSVVYLGVRDGVEYAVKVLRHSLPQAGSGDSEAAGHVLAEFRREAALLASLHHPGLAGIHEVGEADGHPYLIMDLVRGHSLAALLRDDGPMDEIAAVRLVAEVAAALGVAHGAGVVHRDVKPDNIMVGPERRARVIDFGLAARAGGQTGGAAGTFQYSAPEQTGVLHRPVDARADLYSLGVVLYECVTGAVPFRADDVGELIRMHLATPPPDVRTVRRDLTPALAAVVDRLLAKDPDDRYQSTETLAADLGRIAAGETDFALGEATTAPAGAADLVGRAGHLTALTERLTRAVAADGGVVLVEGPAGSGKSRLVRELAPAAGRLDVPVLYGKCEADRAVPLAPVRAAVEGHLASVDDMTLRAAAGTGAGLVAALSPRLGARLGVSTLEAGDNEQQFFAAVAEFLGRLATAAGGLVLHIDDVHWQDGATRRVLDRLIRSAAGSRLLVLLTARDDAGEASALGTEIDAVGGLHLALGPLADAEVADLIARQFGSLEVPPNLVRAVTSRGAGNPLAVLEYGRAIIDAGLVTPSWGRWILDEAGLDALDLPDDIFELVNRRVDGLVGRAREVLTVAAALGTTFSPQVATDVSGVDPTLAAHAFAEAVAHRLIEFVDEGCVFLHDRIREALLGELDEARARHLHQVIAEYLEAGETDSPQRVYEVARHYLHGEVGRAPERVYRAAAEAGALALRQHAPDDALDYLARAQVAATMAGVRPGARFHADLGSAAMRTGRFAAARDHLYRALDAEPDPLRRAGLYGTLANTHLYHWEGGRALVLIRRGIAELARPLPTNPLALGLSGVGLFLASLLVGALPRRWREVHGDRRERYRMLAHLGHLGASAGGLALNAGVQAAFLLRSQFLASRLVSGPEHAMSRSGIAVVVKALGRRAAGNRLAEDAATAVEATGDPTLVAYMNYGCGMVHDVYEVPSAMGAGTGTRMRRALEVHGRWLNVGEYLTGISTLAEMLLLRGYVGEVFEWCERGLARTPGRGEVLGNLFATLGPKAAALAGRPAEAVAGLREVREFLATTPDNRAQTVNVAVAALHLAVEQGEIGEVFERAVREFDELGIRPAEMFWFQRMIFVHQAFGRLAQVSAARAEELDERLAAAATAVGRLRKVAIGPILRAYADCARASLEQLRGDHAAALRTLSHVDAPPGLDVPLVRYEAGRVRARAYAGLDAPADAAHHARTALQLAAEHGWVARARWVEAEFGLDPVVQTGPHGSVTAGASRRSTGAYDVHQRRIQAVHRFAVAASTILDPDQLARVALDEMVGIFSPERAFLFLGTDDGDRLVPYLGRTDTGEDLSELTGYGSTLVEQVYQTGMPLVVAGSEEGAALGSQSTVVHGLRSIMVAPLVLRGRQLGVVYLDSRAAKGIFTGDDVDILTAITNHVALSLETARAAQLELAVQTAERQRDLADTMRRAVSDLTATLDPQAVTRALLDTIRTVVPTDAALLVQRDPAGGVRVAAAQGVAATADGEGVRAHLGTDPMIALALADPAPRHGAGRATAPAPDLLGPLSSGRPEEQPAGWLAVPLHLRGESWGALLAANGTRPYTEAEVHIVSALVSQGMTALDNAQLFTRITELATRDGLTGLYNRRHFVSLAGRGLGASFGPTAGVMIDIDHFKKINDTYGHTVGDQVIHEVARRLSANLRASDIICRYGGEEFAVLLPNTSPVAAAAVAERLHSAVASSPVPTDAGSLAVTVSVGLSQPTDERDVGRLLNVADEALYDAKRSGRNRISTR